MKHILTTFGGKISLGMSRAFILKFDQSISQLLLPVKRIFLKWSRFLGLIVVLRRCGYLIWKKLLCINEEYFYFYYFFGRSLAYFFIYIWTSNTETLEPSFFWSYLGCWYVTVLQIGVHITGKMQPLDKKCLHCHF